MLKNQNILCFGPSDWWGMNPSCTTHIMRGLSKANRVVYINPVSSDLLGIRNRKGLFKRLSRKVKSALKFVRRVDSGLYVISPVFIPLQGVGFFDDLNNVLLKMQLRAIFFLLKMDDPVLWAENVRCADIIPSFKWKLVLYHVSDYFEECPYTRNRNKQHQRQDHISKNSDLSICVSRRLYELRQKNNKNTFYLPHGVDFSIFNQTNKAHVGFEKLQSITCKIAGYFGTLTNQNDIELLEYCAINLPDICFVFAGQITGGDYSRLAKLGNTVFLGKVPYEKIPQLCASFDVCLLPWKMTEWIVNCNPLKLFEYMASGKPIVSVPIEEVVSYSDVISIASDKKQFCEAIKWEIQNDIQRRKQRRIAIAKANSWENHNKQLCEIIEKSFEKECPEPAMCH